MKLGVCLGNNPSGDSCKKAGFSESNRFATRGIEVASVINSGPSGRRKPSDDRPPAEPNFPWVSNLSSDQMIWRKVRLFPHEWTPTHIVLVVLPVLLAKRQRRKTHGCNLYHHYHHRNSHRIFWPSLCELSETRGFYKHDIIRRFRSLDRNI